MITALAIDSRILVLRRAIEVRRLVVAVAVADDDIPAQFAEGLARVLWAVEKSLAATVVHDGTGPCEHVPVIHDNRVGIVLSS
jgi:hypothetical protein